MPCASAGRQHAGIRAEARPDGVVVHRLEMRGTRMRPRTTCVSLVT